MSSKEIVLNLLAQMPEDASLDKIARRIEFVAAVKQGAEELDRGEGIPIEQVRTELHTWIKSQPS